MAAEDFLVDDRRHREAVEAIGERFPQLDVVSSFACKFNKREFFIFLGQKQQKICRDSCKIVTSVCQVLEQQRYLYCFRIPGIVKVQRNRSRICYDNVKQVLFPVVVS